MAWYVPSLKVRKLQSGAPCPGCSLIMHWKDLVAWSGQVDTIYIHQACAEILLTPQEPSVILDENSGAAGEANSEG